MDKPRFQFGMSTLLLATAFTAISVGGMLSFWRAIGPRDREYIGPVLGIFLPVLVPSLFIGYALGRRSLTWKIIVAFAISEVAAVGALAAIKAIWVFP